MSLVSETVAIYSELESSFSTAFSELTASGSISVPNSASMDYPELLTMVNNSVEKGIDIINGIAQDTIFNSSSVSRELTLCNYSKSDIYGNISAEYETEKAYYRQSKDFSVGVMKGAQTNGSQC